MALRPNLAKQKLAAGETVCCVSGLTDPEDIDRFAEQRMPNCAQELKVVRNCLELLGGSLRMYRSSAAR